MYLLPLLFPLLNLVFSCLFGKLLGKRVFSLVIFSLKLKYFRNTNYYTECKKQNFIVIIKRNNMNFKKTC